jgi:hypothetical protein
MLWTPAVRGGLANRVNYGGSSPKMRAQNDSAYDFFRNLLSPALRDAW